MASQDDNAKWSPHFFQSANWDIAPSGHRIPDIKELYAIRELCGRLVKGKQYGAGDRLIAFVRI